MVMMHCDYYADPCMPQQCSKRLSVSAVELCIVDSQLSTNLSVVADALSLLALGSSLPVQLRQAKLVLRWLLSASICPSL